MSADDRQPPVLKPVEMLDALHRFSKEHPEAWTPEMTTAALAAMTAIFGRMLAAADARLAARHTAAGLLPPAEPGEK